MLRMTVLVKRHAELDVDAFHERWRAHGRMIAEEPAFRSMIRRYEQHHRNAVDYRNGDTFDGVAIQEFDDYAGFLAFIQSPEYEAKVRPDEQTLIDIEQVVVLFTDEPETYIFVKGQIALVTGGASGIGAATVDLLRSRGATVVAADLARGDGIAPLDVTDEAAVDALVDNIVAEHGRLDLAANVAGSPGSYAEVKDSSTDGWRDTMAVNLDGAFFCVRAELRAMVPAGRGSIVTVASSAARMGVPGLAAYSASKHAVLGLTRTAALEVARSGVRVNAVCPGTVRTPMLAGFVGGDKQALDAMGRRAPMGRLGEPGEIAEAIVWLLSDAASYVTGAAIDPDGGVAAVG